MRSENGTPSETEEENPAAKRMRTNRDDYTVSKHGPSYRDQSPLRKLPLQCHQEKPPSGMVRHSVRCLTIVPKYCTINWPYLAI